MWGRCVQWLGQDSWGSEVRTPNAVGGEGQLSRIQNQASRGPECGAALPQRSPHPPPSVGTWTGVARGP